MMCSLWVGYLSGLGRSSRRRSSNTPGSHTQQIHPTNPPQRLNAEIERRPDVVGIFPNDAAISRWVGAMLLEKNDECSLNGRCMQLEGCRQSSETAAVRLSAVAR